jgi:type I restriction enzyme S subunit
VEWLGKIPCDWDCVRLKFASELSGVKVAPSNAERYVGLENVQSNSGKFISTEEITPEGMSNAFSCGDVLFGKLRPYLAKSWLADFSGICSSEFLVLTSRKVDAKFLHYFTLTEEFIEQVDSSTYGSKMPRASWDFIGLLDIPVPPHESKKIAEFLDHETAKIDALIEKQQRLIELLKEKRQAVISHAVTKGLNPNVLMKDSGVEWLGNIPKEWEALCFGRLIIKAELGENYDSAEGNEGTPVLKMGNLDRGFVKLEKLECLPAEIKISESAVLKNGDFLFNTRNSLDLVGKVSIWRGELPKATFNSNILRIDFNSLLVETTSYMNYFFNSDLGLSQLRVLAKGTTSVAAIYWKDLTSLRVLLPPPAEQHAIVSHLNSACDRLDELTSKAQRAIALLQESRTALISAAVTGKIDVRDWQAAA